MSVRIGIIGAGGIAGAHINALEQIDGADVVAVCDTNAENAADRAKLAGADAVFDDFNEMLAKVDLDAVWVCTPQTVRAEPIEACIANGRQSGAGGY